MLPHPFKTLALDFSNGRFDSCYPCLSPDIVWDIVGENRFTGRESVMAQCRQVSDYFQSVTTDFLTESVVAEGLLVVVSGRAAFYREGRLLSQIRASDLYHFNESGEIISVTSFCIPLKS